MCIAQESQIQKIAFLLELALERKSKATPNGLVLYVVMRSQSRYKSCAQHIPYCEVLRNVCNLPVFSVYVYHKPDEARQSIIPSITHIHESR